MKIEKKLFIVFFICAICGMCTLNAFAQNNSKPELIFQSGFEGSTHVVIDHGTNDLGAPYEHIAGKDKWCKKKSNWDKGWENVVNNGAMQVQYTGGDSTRRYARVVTDPTNPQNKVLKYWLNDGWTADGGAQKARVQTNLYGIKGGYKEFYQSVRVFLTEDFNVLKDYQSKIGWLTISEFWNNITWGDAKFAFRVTLGISKPVVEHSDLYFLLDGQDFERVNGKEKYTTVWHNRNENIKVPIGKWFTMEYYFKEGNSETGRFYFAITPDGEPKQVVFDVKAFTHNTQDPNPDGITEFNPMKLYTAKGLVNYVGSQGKTLQIYWDDYKLWKNKRPE